ELQRDRRRELAHELLRRDDDDEAARGPRDDLLARMRGAASLDQPPRGIDLVGSVDRDVQLAHLVGVADIEPQLAGMLLACRRGAGDRPRRAGAAESPGPPRTPARARARADGAFRCPPPPRPGLLRAPAR